MKNLTQPTSNGLEWICAKDDRMLELARNVASLPNTHTKTHQDVKCFCAGPSNRIIGPFFFLSSINNWPENSIEKNMLIASTSEWKELIMLFGASRNEWNKHFPNVCVVCVLKCVAALLMKLLCLYFMNKCQMAMVVHTHHTCCQYSEGGKQLFRHQPCDLR